MTSQNDRGHASANGHDAPKTTRAPGAIDDSTPDVGAKSTGASISRVISVPAGGKFPFSLPGKLELVLSQHGQAFVVVRPWGNPLALPVGCKKLNNILRAIAHEEGVSLRKADINDANDYLIAKAEMAGITRPVWYRVAPPR